MGKAPRFSKAERELFALNHAGHHATFILAAGRVPPSAQGDGYLEILQADSYQALFRLQEAEQFARKSLKLCPKAARRGGFCMLGQILQDAGRLAEAIEQYKAAIRAEPSHAQGYIYLGGLYAYLGDAKNSSEFRERATRCKNGAIDEAWLNLGYLRISQERFAEARKCYQRALKIDPKDKDVKNGLREIELISNGMPKISLNALRAKIVRISKGVIPFPSYLLFLTRHFLKKADPDDAFILYMQCVALGQIGRFHDALALLPRVVEIRPKSKHHVLDERATICARMMNFDDAAQYFKKVLSSRPDYVPSSRGLGTLLRKQGRYAEAEKLLRFAVRKDSANEYNWKELGHLYRSSERFAKAEQCYEKALALNSKSKDVRVALQDVRAAGQWLSLHDRNL